MTTAQEYLRIKIFRYALVIVRVMIAAIGVCDLFIGVDGDLGALRLVCMAVVRAAAEHRVYGKADECQEMQNG